MNSFKEKILNSLFYSIPFMQFSQISMMFYVRVIHLLDLGVLQGSLNGLLN